MIALRQRSPLEWSAHLRAVMYHDARYPEVEHVLTDSTAQLGRVLARMVFQVELRDVLAFGAGESLRTVVEALGGLGGGHLTVVEDDPSWEVDQWALVTAKRGVNARLIGSPLFFRVAYGTPHHAYGAGAAAAVAERAPYDLVLVDAPHGHIGRDGALHLAVPHLAPGALIVVRKEGDTVDRWLDSYPGLVLLHLDRALGEGLAVLGYTGNPTRRVTPRGILTSAVREAYAWIAQKRTNGTSGSESVHVRDDLEQRNETGLPAHHGG